MKKLILACLMLITPVLAQANIYSTGTTVSGIRDFREVLRGTLFRGGANNGQAPMNSTQLRAMCERNMGVSVYLYNKGFSDPGPISCSQGSMIYATKMWSRDAAVTEVLQAVYNSITTGGKPVFIHCWYGIHATGMVAAMALMQFCDATPSQAVAYWKVGIAPQLQYPHVIEKIENFQPRSHLRISAADKARICPQM